MFFQSMFTPSSVSDPDPWLVNAMGGGRAKSGVAVTARTAMQLTAVRACVSRLAESVAQLPCEVYRRMDNDGRERAVDHPLYGIVHDVPNRWQTAFEYFEQSQGLLGLRGDSFNFIIWSGNGQIEEIIPLDVEKIQVFKGADSRPYYLHSDTQKFIPHRNMHHVRGFSLNGYTGVSPIQTNRDPIGLAISTEHHAAAVFRNGTALSGVLERPEGTPKLNQEAVNMIKSSWKTEYAGSDNAFSVAVLQDGMSFKEVSMSNSDAQLLASREWGVVEIARLFNIPPHMIQHLNNATFSNIEHQGIYFVIYTLMPWLRRHEQAMARDLLTHAERRSLYVEFNVSGLLRGDLTSRYSAYATARQWGWLSVNDIRRLENLPPIPGGNTYLQPMNMTDAQRPVSVGQAPQNSPIPRRETEVSSEDVKNLKEECQI